MTKAYNPKVYYSDVEQGKFCNNCNDRHTFEYVGQVVIGSEREPFSQPNYKAQNVMPLLTQGLLDLVSVNHILDNFLLKT